MTVPVMQFEANARSCGHCGDGLRKRKTESTKTFAMRRYCSRTCAIRSGFGRPVAQRLIDYRVIVPSTECWEWSGCRNPKGYGRTSRTPAFAHECLVHRLSWIINRGEIPAGLHVLHRCDNPPCFNPGHLFLGTNQDNNDDKIAKGRVSKPIGILNPRAKLTEDDVLAIRVDERSATTLARIYGVAPPTITRIRTGTGWRRLGEAE